MYSKNGHLPRVRALTTGFFLCFWGAIFRYVLSAQGTPGARFRAAISACKDFSTPLGSSGNSSSVPPPIAGILLQVDHVFVLSFKSCRLQLPTSFSGKATCVVGEKLDACAPREFIKGAHTHAMKVSFTHAAVLQLAYDRRARHVAILEDDVVLRRGNYSRQIVDDFTNLINSYSWSFIRFGFRPYFLEESSRGHCSSKCYCIIRKHISETFCELTHAGCDMRSSDFYVIRAQFYMPFQSLIIDLKQKNSKRIVDMQPMRSFKNQWLILPQVSIQSQLDIPSDFQIGLGALYVKKCVHPRPLPSAVTAQFSTAWGGHASHSSLQNRKS